MKRCKKIVLWAVLGFIIGRTAPLLAQSIDIDAAKKKAKWWFMRPCHPRR